MDELRKLSTPSLSSRHSLTRSNSRSKGINFNTVTPNPLKTSGSWEPKEATTIAAPMHYFQYDFVLPLTEQLRSLDVDEQLRLLAMKEMTVVEIKDGMSNLKMKLDQTERDLHQLRAVIQRSLYMEMRRPQKSPSHKTKEKDTMNPTARKQRCRKMENCESKENVPPETSQLWSNLSKPINFIQHIDTMLLLGYDESLSQRLEHESISPLKDRSNTSSMSVSDDMFQAVSSSLWTFVNDVKTNMLATLNEPQQEQTMTEKDRMKYKEEQGKIQKANTDKKLTDRKHQDTSMHNDITSNGRNSSEIRRRTGMKNSNYVQDKSKIETKQHTDNTGDGGRAQSRMNGLPKPQSANSVSLHPPQTQSPAGLVISPVVSPSETSDDDILVDLSMYSAMRRK